MAGGEMMSEQKNSSWSERGLAHFIIGCLVVCPGVALTLMVIWALLPFTRTLLADAVLFGAGLVLGFGMGMLFLLTLISKARRKGVKI